MEGAVRAKIRLDYPRNDKGTTQRGELMQILKSAPNNEKIQNDLETLLEATQVPLAGIDLYESAMELFTRTDTTRWQNLYYYSMYTGVWFTGEELTIINRLLSAIAEEVDAVTKNKTVAPSKAPKKK